MTIKDIAKLAGVSHATVSRVMNGRSGVSSATKELILRLIHEHNFAPHNSARSLIMGKTYTIGLLVLYDVFRKEFPADFLSNVLAGMTTELSKYGYSLNILFDQLEDKKDLIRTSSISSNKFDGIFLLSLENEPQIPYRFAQINLPMVLVNQKIESSDISCILADDEQGAYNAVEYLLINGHRRIAFLEGNPIYSTSTLRRLGYMRALRDWDITPDFTIMKTGNYNQECAYDAVKQLLDNDSEFTALFSSNDFMALGAYSAIKEKGLSIPKDISIIGYDDMQFTQFISPALTTICKPRMEMGKKAVSLMIKHLNTKEGQRTEPESIILSTSLVVRDSVSNIQA